MEVNVAVEPFVALGVDPGTRYTGISGVERFPDASFRSRGVRVSFTEPSKEKSSSRYRTSADDQRRLREHWIQIKNAVTLLKPRVIGVENYSIFEPVNSVKLREAAEALIALLGGGSAAPEELARFFANENSCARFHRTLSDLTHWLAQTKRDSIGLGNAAKTIGVYATVLVTGFEAGIPVLTFEPSDRTRKIGGRKGASKEEVGQAVEARVHGLHDALVVRVKQKSRWQHAWDATAFAILAAEEWQQMALDAGAR